MKSVWGHPIFRSRYLLAVFAGLVWTCAFPKIGLAGFAWVAPGLIAAAALGTRGAEAFRVGYMAGLAHYLSMLYWLLLIPYRWQGIPLGPALGWLVLSAFLALFTGLWVWALQTSLKPKVQSPKSAEESLEPPIDSQEFQDGSPAHTAGFAFALPESWAGRVLWMLFGAAAWVGLEMLLARIFGGFPWGLLGVSQYPLTPLIQFASVTGVYGISFLVVWVSLALLSAALALIRRPSGRSAWVAELFIPVLLAAVLFNIGFRQIRHAPPPQRTLRVMLVQPSIPQNLIWDPEADTNRFAELVRYSDQVLTNESDLLIWPESALPKMLRYDTNTLFAVIGLAQKHDVWMIIGSDDAEPSRRAGNPDEEDIFNSSFLIDPEGYIAERYNKRNLVIFGEYIPLQTWLPFMKWFTPSQGSFAAGTSPVEFNLKSLDVKTSVLICFEDIFPQLGRTDVKKDTDFLVNITNDGWFDKSAAQWQHATTALFRAVENRLPLVRCCNNGLTCWIDAQGRIRDILRDSKGTVYGMGFLRAEIPVLMPEETRQLTFYTRHGDVFGWSCVGFVVLGFGARIVASRRSRPAETPL